MLDRPASARDRTIGIRRLVAAEHHVDGRVADRMRGNAPAILVERARDRREVRRRHGVDPEISAVPAQGADEWLRHEAAFEAAVDAELDAADAHPFVAFVLLERRARENLAHGGRVTQASASTRRRQIDVQAQREQVALARLEHEIERVEKLAQPEAASHARAGDAVGIERALSGEHIVDGGRAQRRQRRQGACVVHELAVELAIFILADLAACRRLRLLGDAPFGERRRVEHILVSAAHQHPRVDRRILIELARTRQALLLELRLMPVAVADDDGARLRILGSAPDDREQFVKRAGLGEIDAGAAADAMQMAVSETRRHEAAAEIDNLGGRANMSAHTSGGAGRDEAPILDCKTLNQRRVGVRREDLAVENHKVGGLRGGRGDDTECEGSAGKERKADADLTKPKHSSLHRLKHCGTKAPCPRSDQCGLRLFARSPSPCLRRYAWNAGPKSGPAAVTVHVSSRRSRSAYATDPSPYTV